ncbi:unnamed protein product [Peronospora belbahrii]|uniref:MI domain-containing protein n=1 Tax=Peronospora belbahrii TaxID=622444 RepID=A0ABN8D1A1_9STRA|nr:unnamed protein product [Peronospora belbahrii]
MDEKPSVDVNCRGGSRHGGLGRKRNSSKVMYRPVKTAVIDLTRDVDEKSSRLVQVIDDSSEKETEICTPFESSLRSSLKETVPVPSAKRNERFVRMENDKPVFSTKERNSKELPKKEMHMQTKGTRQVILLSSPSPQKGIEPTKGFVSSLTQSIDNKGGDGKVKKEEVGSRDKGSSLRRSDSRESLERSNSRELREEKGLRNRSISRTKLTRKNSNDSISSQRSDRSDKSYRNERYHEEYRSNLNDGTKIMHKLSIGSPRQVPFKSSLKGSLSATNSSQDIRIRKEGLSSGIMGRSFGRPPQELTLRRSSLDGGASSLRRVNSGFPVEAPAGGGNSQDPRPTNLQRLPSISGGVKRNDHVGELISPKPQKTIHVIPDTIVKEPAVPVVGELERKRRADILRERMELRMVGRGSSLAQLMKAPLCRKDSMDKDVRRSPPGERNESEGAPSSVDAGRDARTQEYYAKLDKENAEREASRLAVPFKSSLKLSMEHDLPKTQSSTVASIDAVPLRKLRSPLEDSTGTRTVRMSRSSLPAATVPSRSIMPRAKKLQYSLAELRRLMVFALPKPADLPEMKVVEVIAIGNPRSVAKQSFERLGVGYGMGKSIGGSIRKGDGSDARGGRGPRSQGGRGARNQGGLRDNLRDRQGRGGRGGRGGGRGGRGGGGGGRGDYGRPPPPPLYDGPIEPLTLSANRWKPTKEKETSALEKALNYIKSLLNKLTREKFAKLTNELCAVEIDSFVLLSSIVATIMDKALEEPSFADVYSDLCKEFHTRTIKKAWSFLSVLSDEKGSFFWTAIDKTTFTPFVGPFDSPSCCLDDIEAPVSATSSTCDSASVTSVQFRRHGDYLVAVGEKEPGVFYYSRRKISEIGDDEPFGGPFESAELARHAAASQTTFLRLLVNRCQGEFEKTNKHIGDEQEKQDEEEVDPRRREILAMRAKAKMLGNIRFIGELYKVDLIKQSGVQGCIFYLLGLELMPGLDGQEGQAQAIRFPDEADLEALCKMLATAGKKFDQPKTKTIMKIIILRMVELSDDLNLPSRARFLIKDVLETRDHMWEPRRKELQQKTLEEVRREAQKLQQQGKNAQHDDVQRRRHKTRVSSAQLAKQSSNLIVARKVDPDEPEGPEAKELSAAQMSTRVKSIIQEYISIMDLDEAITCVQELPVGPYHIELVEQAINTALEGKTTEREHAVELLVRLYERGALDANSIQTALMNVMEFLEDMKIDLPLIHQYSALIFGRLISVGCFGFSWILSEALAHCVECKLTSLVFPEVLSVLEMESDERTVIRMLTDEEVTPESVLPAAMRASKADVTAYLREYGIENFFGGGDSDEEGEFDPEVAGRMRSTLEEYLCVKDFNEVVQCIEEFDTIPDRWLHFVQIMLMFSLEAKQSVRKDVSDLLIQLFVEEKIISEDIEAAVKIILDDYNDLRVDIPQLAINLSELWTPLFAKQALSMHWLIEASSHLVASGRAADIVDALLFTFNLHLGQEALVTWWKMQSDVNAIWTQVSPLDERLAKWKKLLE